MLILRLQIERLLRRSAGEARIPPCRMSNLANLTRLHQFLLTALARMRSSHYHCPCRNFCRMCTSLLCGMPAGSSIDQHSKRRSKAIVSLFTPFWHYTQVLPCRTRPSQITLDDVLTIASFITPKSSILRRNQNLLRPLGDVRKIGQEWATRAGDEALRAIDRPTLSTVRTCKLLQLFWFSRGESSRNVILNCM